MFAFSQHENWISGLDYDNKIYPNDIALLYLARPVNNSNVIELVPDDGADYTGEVCTISGWGYTG